MLPSKLSPRLVGAQESVFTCPPHACYRQGGEQLDRHGSMDNVTSKAWRIVMKGTPIAESIQDAYALLLELLAVASKPSGAASPL